jgi:hypothetical protein
MTKTALTITTKTKTKNKNGSNKSKNKSAVTTRDSALMKTTARSTLVIATNSIKAMTKIAFIIEATTTTKMAVIKTTATTIVKARTKQQ